MAKLAFLFPGQGSQAVGMGKEFYDRYPIARTVFAAADKALGFSVSDLCFNGPEAELRKTANTQPAILTVSVAIYRVLTDELGLKPDIVAGHSLGEYSALVAAGSLSFTDAVVLVNRRGQLMQDAVPLGEGAMAAILGLERQTVIAVCREVQLQVGLVQAVNYNCPGQIVIAGKTEAVEIAAEKLKAAGAKKTVILPVSAPFHSSLMQPAADKLAIELEKVVIGDAKIPVVANYNSEIVRAGRTIKKLLVRQAANPILWEDCMQQMITYGATTFIEVGPGKVLTGFSKKIAKDLNKFNVEDINSMEKTLDYFREVR